MLINLVQALIAVIIRYFRGVGVLKKHLWEQLPLVERA